MNPAFRAHVPGRLAALRGPAGPVASGVRAVRAAVRILSCSGCRQCRVHPAVQWPLRRRRRRACFTARARCGHARLGSVKLQFSDPVSARLAIAAGDRCG